MAAGFREGFQCLDEIEIPGKSRDKEIVVVPPDLGASDKLQPIVDLVDGVLGDAIAARMEGSKPLALRNVPSS